jgi:phage-related tail fiber protein
VNRRFPSVALLAVLFAGFSAASASSSGTFQTATSGTLTMSSPQFEYIGQGRPWDFQTPDFSFRTVADATGRYVEVRAENFNTAQGEDVQWSFLTFEAPQGQQLTPGTTYTDARRSPLAWEPGLSVLISGRGCNELTGEFTVLDIAFTTFGDVQRFHATFKQYCEFGSVPLEGEVNIINPPAQAVTLSVDPDLSIARSEAVIHGTVTCAVPGPVTLSGTLTQGNKMASFDDISLACTTSPAAWTASVTPASGPRFSPGSATVTAEGVAADPTYINPDGTPMIAKFEVNQTVALTRPDEED